MIKKTIQNVYIAFIFLLSMILLYVSFYYRSDFSILDLLFYCAIVIIAETFLIISPTGVATSVAPAIYIYISLMSQPFVVIIAVIAGCIFPVTDDNGVKKHIFNTRLSTTLFNMANLILSIGTVAWIISYPKMELDFYLIIPLVIAGLFFAEVVNVTLVSVLLKITQDINPILVFRSTFKTFPSSIAIGMIGIFLSYAEDSYNKFFVIVFFVPLLLARYSFKLYFESQRMALDTIHALNEALHAKDAYTGGHTGRVEQYAVDLAKAYGLPPADCELIRTAALLHDIGKIGIPDDILNKPGRLSKDEFELIQEHSSIGAKILGNVNSLKRVSEIIIQHHERYDGTGYPHGIKGDAICIEASILMISDSYDAMTTNRPYRNALTKEESISELEKYRGTQFHPKLAKCFIEGVLNQDSEIEINEILTSKETAALLKKTKTIIEEVTNLPQDAIEKEAEAMEKRAEEKHRKVHPSEDVHEDSVLSRRAVHMVKESR